MGNNELRELKMIRQALRRQRGTNKTTGCGNGLIKFILISALIFIIIIYLIIIFVF